jgi:RNA polymerase sigma-70 factor (ECF subfamily)
MGKRRNAMANFQELYETHARDVYRFSLWLAGDSSEAEDITSETFVRAWARSGKIRTETLKAYLFTISRNIYLEQRRKRKKHVVLKDVYPDPASGPEERTETIHRLRRVEEILQSLPEIDRSAFVLRVQQELSYDEIARVLETSLTAAKVKVHRVRKKLVATCLAKEVD